MTIARKRVPRTHPVALRDTRHRRIHTVSFDPVEDDWLQAVVAMLVAEGH